MVVLHFTVYLAKAYQSHVRGTDATDKDVLHHYVRTLALLQQRVGDAGNELATSDRTIEVVMGLATVAAFKHDGEVARKHLEGLKKMVALRGGPWGLERKVLFNICYADVGRSLSTGEKTVFFAGEGAWSSYIAAPTKATRTSRNHMTPMPPDVCFHALDARLQAVYTDLSELARAANLAVWSNRDTDTAAYSRQGTFYRGIMFSALYRLLNLDFGSGNVDAVMRLGLLAVASTLFSQWRGSKERYEYIAQELLGALVSLEKEEYGLPREVVLWLYVVGCVSVFNERERAVIMPTLVQLLGQMQMKTWDETRAVLKAFLWVDAMHDTVAEEVLVPVIFPRWEQQQQLLVSAK
ncbi:hypothetical protein BU23DRAFT_531859 [Bimuria novae-zelandiae CBS 107.79]|uniref:Uncharacterized protein n=1 Tax=Bimuria novae-zelandiae CBS 107.79 TaxID=1447943 RepID=A0A6A5VLM0_9PLEO|nr:hypothetical protein BU23DRAFT_531859 [Bimuria novae-zelandiae CBS 107.79]